MPGDGPANRNKCAAASLVMTRIRVPRTIDAVVELLRQERLGRGFSYQDVADETGLDQSTIWKIECAGVDPRTSSIDAYSGVMGYSAYFLVPQRLARPPPGSRGYSSVPATLRRCRLDSGMTQYEVSGELGLQREYLSALEQGRHVVRFSLLAQLASMYSRTALVLVSRGGSRAST